VRKTITLPESTVQRVRDAALEGESFSATVTRLLEESVRLRSDPFAPSYVASGEWPADLSERVEQYLRELTERR
jgi:hypothetical protein